MRRIEKLVGNSTDYNLQERTLHSICLILVAAGFFATMLNIHLKLPKGAIFSAITVSIIAYGLYYLSKVKRMYNIAHTLFFFACYLLLIIFWFYNYGSDGPQQIMILSMIIWQQILIKRHQLLWLGVNILFFTTLMHFEYYIVIPIGEYSHPYGKIMDIIATYIILGFAIYLSLKSLAHGYNQEQNKTKRQNEELQRLNQELLSVNSKLKKMDDAKTKLFSVISHDLRNSVGNFSNLSETLATDADLTKEDIQQVSQNLWRSSKNMNSLLGNLLEWSKLRMDRLSVFPEACKTKNILEKNLKLFELNIKKKKLQIEASVPESQSLFVDPNLLDSILRNLISNAIKFTPVQGEITIYSLDNPRSKYCETVIRDTGIGMTAEEITELLNMQSFFSKAGTNNERGSGLGFHLCQEFAQLNQGSIRVKSKKGEGSEFILRLPKYIPAPS